MKENLELLKEVLSIPTQTYKEGFMIEFLEKWLTENQIDYSLDRHGNVYATKQESKDLPENFYFPCVISHTDTVHVLDTINVREESLPNAQGEIKLSLKAYTDFNIPTGIGGDDKCGVFACLTLLKELPYLKAAFFVSEETGCHGSKNADETFFSNVGYGISNNLDHSERIIDSPLYSILIVGHRTNPLNILISLVFPKSTPSSKIQNNLPIK
jgi:di/tripeptidase